MSLSPSAALAALGLFACAGGPPPPAHAPQPAVDAGHTAAPAWTLRGEFETVDEVLVAWDSYFEDYLVDLVGAVAERVPVTIAAPAYEDLDELRDALATYGLREPAVQFVEPPVDSIWIRDYGPIVARDNYGDPVVVDLRYAAGGHDDAFPDAVAGPLWTAPVVHADLDMEGGNLLANGRGTCVTTDRVIETPRFAGDADALRAAFRDAFGCERTLILPALAGEETGHVDMYVTIPAPDRALVAQFDPELDPENAARTDDAAALLSRAGFRVSRLPMGYTADGVFRTYTNVLPLPGAVLAPIYPDHPDGEHAAFAALARAYPGREIVPIAATEPMALGGSIHCTAMAVMR